MLRFHLRSCFPWFFQLVFPVEIFAFLEGAICLFRIHFWSDLSWFGQHFGSQNPPGALPGGIQKKLQKLMPIFIDFGMFWRPPGGTLNCLKTTWTHPVGTPIFAPKAILSQSGLPGWNFSRLGLPKRQFWKPCSCIFDILGGLGVLYQDEPCKLQDIMCLATLRLARHSGSSSSSSSNSSLARHVMVCNISSCKSQQKQHQQQ